MSTGSVQTDPFWDLGYYRSKRCTNWSGDLDEGPFENPLCLQGGTIFLVELVEDRPVCVGGDWDEERFIYIEMKALDPRDADKTVRLRFTADVRSNQFERVEPLELLALAGEGLVP
jgi:hypothetical protein